MGTVALGSLIIAIVKFIKAIIENMQRQAQEGGTSACGCICACICRCFLNCLENFLSFISKNAYIMTAIYGTDFITSAKDAFNLLMRNILNVIVLDKVS
jgi:choline transporter-like protein 2/4/5